MSDATERIEPATIAKMFQGIGDYQTELEWRRVLNSHDGRTQVRDWLIQNDPLVYRGVKALEAEGILDRSSQDAALVLMLSRFRPSGKVDAE